MIKFNILDKIREAQQIAVKENMKVNAIKLSEDFVKIPKLVTRSTEYGCVSVTYPMICGLRCYIDDNELPEEYAFALFDDNGESHSECDIRKVAKWISASTKPGVYAGMKCSLCGARIKYSEFYNGNHNFCHKCGAKMENSNK